MYSARLNTYQQNQMETASPERILLMLYDGAIRFTRQAMAGLEKKDQQVKSHGISKAVAIITEFSNSLDREIGGQIAEDLDALYHFMIREMIAANLHDDMDKLRIVEKLLVDLRQTWGEAVEINRKEQGQNAGAAEPMPVPGPQREEYRSISISR